MRNLAIVKTQKKYQNETMVLQGKRINNKNSVLDSFASFIVCAGDMRSDEKM